MHKNDIFFLGYMSVWMGTKGIKWDGKQSIIYRPGVFRQLNGIVLDDEIFYLWERTHLRGPESGRIQTLLMFDVFKCAPKSVAFFCFCFSATSQEVNAPDDFLCISAD